jgi:hypothetical protein
LTQNKTCIVCHLDKSTDCFPKRKYKKCVGFRNECKACVSVFQKQYRSKNKTRIAAQKKEWTLNHLDQKRDSNYNWFLKNKEKAQQSVRNHRINNLPYYRFKRAARRAQIANATPKWADLEKIKEIYKNCPVGYHVDHIIPLTNDLVCGLHVPDNLQYLPASENLKKGNKIL